MITRADIRQRIGQIMDNYRFDSKSTETSELIKTDVGAYTDTLGDDWRVNTILYNVDNHAFMALIIAAYKDERVEHRDVHTIWVEEPQDRCADSQSYERAMGIIK